MAAPYSYLTPFMAYVGTSNTDAATKALDAAWDLVCKYAGIDVSMQYSIPDDVLQRATTEVGAELFHRKNTKNGIAQFATPDAVSPIRVARDPMVAAYPLLRSWVGGGFA